MHQGQPIALSQIGSYLPIQLVILQQLIQRFEHRIALLRHFRHPRKHIFWVITVYEHLLLLYKLSARILPPK
jgi:hypothetical protein